MTGNDDTEDTLRSTNASDSGTNSVPVPPKEQKPPEYTFGLGGHDYKFLVNDNNVGAPNSYGEAGASKKFGELGASNQFGETGASKHFGATGASTNFGQTGASTNFGATGASTNFGTYGAPDMVSSPEVRMPSDHSGGYIVEQAKVTKDDALRGGFSYMFKFKPTLMNLYFKIDHNKDHRLSKQELQIALKAGKFREDELLLAGLLWQHFDNIRRNKLSNSTFFDNRGLSVEEVLAYSWNKYVPADSLPEEDTSTKPRRATKS